MSWRERICPAAPARLVLQLRLRVRRRLPGASLSALLGLALLAAGCRHRSAPAVLPAAATAPVPLPNVPEGKISAVVQPVASVPTPLPSVTVTPPKPKRIRRKPVVPAAVAAAPPPTSAAPAGGLPPAQAATPSSPVQAPGAPPPPPAAAETLGALSSGTPSDPALHARATDLLAELKKRIEGLPAPVVKGHAEGVARVRLFWREADTALKSGDADGAWTLATKARVLLDELTG